MGDFLTRLLQESSNYIDLASAHGGGGGCAVAHSVECTTPGE